MSARRVLALAFACAAAPATADFDARAALAQVDAEYEATRARCNELAGQVKTVCIAAAQATRRIEKAEIAARAQGTAQSRYDARVARAEAESDLERARCGLRAGAERELCVADARVAEARAKDAARLARRDEERREQASRR